MKIPLLSLLLVGVSFVYSPCSHAVNLSTKINLEDVKKQLAGSGLVVEIHGAVESQGIVVAAVRNPQNFFEFEIFSVLGKDAVIQKNLFNFHRHDKVKLFGVILDNPSKQNHIEVSSFELVEAFKNPYSPPDYGYEAQIPDELLNRSSAEFLVHAVQKDGEVLVLEFKDRVVPVYVKPEQAVFTKNLARNDIVRVSYQVARNPNSPAHLKLSTTAAVPIEVLESVMKKHGLPADVTGYLVLFPKSPQVMFDVYALSESLKYSLKRQYTLINFDDQQLFAKIRKLCADAWAKDPQNFVNGRNKLLHNRIRFRARGVFNQVDANQANVQILINDIKDLEQVE